MCSFVILFLLVLSQNIFQNLCLQTRHFILCASTPSIFLLLTLFNQLFITKIFTLNIRIVHVPIRYKLWTLLDLTTIQNFMDAVK